MTIIVGETERAALKAAMARARRRKKRERYCHVDFADAAALTSRNAFHGSFCISCELIKPAVRGEEAGDRAGVGKSHFPKVMMQTVRHEPERRHVLFTRDLGHVLAKLFFAFARVAGGPFRLDHRKDGPVRAVQTEIREAVPRRWIIALHGDFELYLRVVAKVPARSLQLRVYEKSAKSLLRSDWA